MKCDVRIWFDDDKVTEITSVDRAELLAIGDGVLSVIEGDTNYCYNLRDIMMYTIRNRKDSE